MPDVPWTDFVAGLSLDTIGGSEKMPVLEGTTAAHVTPSALSDYVINQLTSAAAVTPTSGDAVLMERAGQEGTFDLNTMSAYVLSRAWAASTEVTPATSADKILINREGTTRQLDIDTVAAYVNTAALDISSLATGTPGASDRLLYGSGSDSRAITLANFQSLMWTDLVTWINARDAVVTVANSDRFLVIQGGTPKYVTPVEMATYFNTSSDDVTGPVTTTENYVPQWDSTTRLLKNGLNVKTSMDGSTTAVDTAIVTEQGIAEFFENIGNLNIDGAADIGADLADADLLIVDDGGGGTNRKAAMSRIRTYVSAAGTFSIAALDIDGATDIGGALADGDLIIVDDGAGGTNRKAAMSRVKSYCQSIRLDDFASPEDNTDLDATTSAHGLLPKLGGGTTNFLRADGTWADPTGWDGDIADIDLDGAFDIGADLNDQDLVLVDDGANGTNRKSAISRFFTYVVQKLQASSAKTTPVSADLVLIQDSEAANVFKECTLTQLMIGLPNFVGDAGGGGVKGAVPAPGVGDGSANRFLKADGTWATPGVASGWDGDIADIDFNGATDISADLADNDLLIVDDGAGNNNRKSAVSRIWTFVVKKLQGLPAKTSAADGDILTIQDSADSNALKELTLSNLKAYLETIGTYDTLFVSAAAMVPCESAPPEVGTFEYVNNDINFDYLAFDSSTEEYAQFYLTMPESWDRGTVKVRFHWSSATGSSLGDGVVWNVKARVISNEEAIDGPFGDTEAAIDILTAVNGQNMQTTGATNALTVGNLPILSDLIFFDVSRDTSSVVDDMDEDAWLFGVTIQYRKANSVAAW
ncbi:MAG: hypothetical protein AAF745_00190 [Planctomycetota bacterium]